MEIKKLLIVGLGNPGNGYSMNRHNIGFRLLDSFLNLKNISFDRDKNCSSAKINGDSSICFFLKPLEFMNLSGNCVGKFLIKYKIKPVDLIVVHDELDFIFGRTQLKFSGGHAGHNGLKSIIETIGTKDFSRLRIGIGRPLHGDISNHVLSNFSTEEESKIPEIFNSFISILEKWILEKNNN